MTVSKYFFVLIALVSLLSCVGTNDQSIDESSSRIDTSYLANGDQLITEYTDFEKTNRIKESFFKDGFNYSINEFINDSTISRKTFHLSSKELNIVDTVIIVPKKGIGNQLHNIGISMTYFENGALRNITPYDEEGNTHGSYESYFNNGKLKTKVVSVHGIRSESYNYYENGNIQMVGFFNSENRRDGTWKYYLENGELGTEVVFKNDQEVKRKVITSGDIPLLPTAPEN